MLTEKENIITSVEAIIINYNTAALTLQCIKSMLDTVNNPNLSITVVDNASEDGSPEIIKSKFPQVKVIENDVNCGYAAAVNRGAAESRVDYLIISNSDVIYHQGAIEQIISYMESNPDVAVTGPQQIYPDGIWQFSGGTVPGLWYAMADLFFINTFKRLWNRYLLKFKIMGGKPKKIGYVDGAAMFIRKKVFDDVGGFDEDYFFYTEEADFCYRISKKGDGVILYPSAMVTHLRGGSSQGGVFAAENIAALTESKFIFCRKHYPRWVSFLFKFQQLFFFSIYLFFWKFIKTISFGQIKEKAKAKYSNTRNFYFAYKKIKL